MGQYLQTNGDYTVVASGEDAAAGGTITLNTGPQNIGQVVVTGTLVVEGETVTVSAENLDVVDNIIVLNKGESGAGISVLTKKAGIQIDRGSLQPASILYDETTDTWEFSEANILDQPTAFNYTNSSIRVRNIRTGVDQPNLTLIGENSTGVVNVYGTFTGGVTRPTAYESRVTDPDDIPNKAYVDNSIRDNPTFQIVDDNTRVIVTDKDVTGSLAYITAQTGYTTNSESAVSVIVDTNLISQFYDDKVLIGESGIQGIEIIPTLGEPEITTATGLTDTNIYVKTVGTGKLRTNRGIQLDEHTDTLLNSANTVVIYSNAPSIGKSGVFVSNDVTNDELITKNKALLLSMIF